MKHLIAILLALPMAAGAESVVLGTAFEGDQEIELYSVNVACAKGQLGGAKFPIGERHRYVMGCWTSTPDLITIKFEDGKITTLTRRQLIPRARLGQML